jgi:hypothetical protein
MAKGYDGHYEMGRKDFEQWRVLHPGMADLGIAPKGPFLPHDWRQWRGQKGWDDAKKESR